MMRLKKVKCMTRDSNLSEYIPHTVCHTHWYAFNYKTEFLELQKKFLTQQFTWVNVLDTALPLSPNPLPLIFLTAYHY